MSLQTFKISPDQWSEFDTYEGRFQIEALRDSDILILCDNIVIVPSISKDSLLPDFFAADQGVYPKIDGVRLTFTNVSYLRLRGALFDPTKGKWVEGSDQMPVMLTHNLGTPGAAEHTYELSGVGRLSWPPMSADDFLIETSNYLTLTFDDREYFPTGGRKPDKSEQGSAHPSTTAP